FGFERGAFTDARQAKRGLFEVAQGGTLFLDEVGLLPEVVQSKLLKAIEDREVRRLGATRSAPVDIWILAATSEDLAAARRTRRFQEPLYHRLSVLTFRLPPLRTRREDILILAEQFLARACADYVLGGKHLAADAREALVAHPWPGNIRELANVMERVALLSEESIVTAQRLDLALPVASPSRTGLPRREVRAGGPDASPDPLERQSLLEALQATGWNISQAAVRLGVPRNTMRYRMERYGLQRGGSLPVTEPVAPTPSDPPAPEPVAPAAAPAPPAPIEPPGPSAVRWEHRRVTLLRTTVLAPRSETLVPDRYAALDLVLGKIATFGGRLEELAATGIVAAFGLEPVEDAPRRAAHAAMAILKAAERSRTGGEAVDVKLVIHVGEFVVGQASGAAEMVLEGKQEAWALLGALADQADPNTIAISEAAAAFLEPRFELVPGDSRVGLPGRAYQLVGLERTGLGRRLARFVGRSRELELLQSQLATVLRGRGQVVGIVGEAGLGKTRLVAEFRQTLGDQVAYLEGHCLSYGSVIPYLPLVDLVRGDAGVTDADPPEAVTEKVRGRLATLGLDVEDALPSLLHVLGVKAGTERLSALSPEAVQARVFEILRQMSLRASRQRPLVLVVENLHWVDPTSEEYLASLVESLAGAPLLLLLTHRPGYRPPWIEKSYVTQIALQPLAPGDSLALVRSVVAAETVPQSLADLILSRAEGNPFFLEELTLAVSEPGDPSTGVAVPATIQDVLLARISRLADEPKWVLQTASVLGREVPLRVLKAVWSGPGGLEPHLRELIRLEFLYEESGLEERVYLFKHALTREVAHESLLPARRRALHAAAAEALERLFVDRLDEIVDRLAHHYALADDTPRAVAYLTRVADKAARSYAHVEASTVLQDALGRAERLPAPERDRRVVELTLRQAHSLYFLGRFSESLELLRGQQGRLTPLEDPALAGPYHFWLGYTWSHLGDHEQADAEARQAIVEAERAGDAVTLGQARYLLARGGFWSGRFAEGAAEGRRAVALLEATDARWWLGAAHWGVAFNYGFMGEFEPALAATREAQVIGQAIDDPRLQTYAAWTTGWLEAARGDGEAGIRACRQSLEHSPDPVNTADAMSFLGGAYLEHGDARQAVECLERAVAEWTRFQHRPMLGWFTAVLADAHLLRGEVGRARELARQGHEIAVGVGFGYAVGWARRTLGRVARVDGDRAAADRHLQEALGTFAGIGARFEAARTHLDLADLARTAGDRETALRHAGAAGTLFAALQVPLYERRAGTLAEP
ncbi:MAG: sigma 54-interacting transcriptional regulator, partial [Candidatus Rokubacteria bacterium]|nr:sigma 54-interacting transcriptional regulator [Candidatus Rokubacteria bacterium]